MRWRDFADARTDQHIFRSHLAYALSYAMARSIYG